MADELYRELVDLNAAAFERGSYDVAYHILMAAMHCGSDDRAALEAVRQQALEQLAVIDADHPEYEHSSVSAGKRGHLSIYAMLADQARAMAAIAKMRKESKP